MEYVESPTAVYCGMMKYNGVPMNVAAMFEKQKEAEEKLTALRSEIDSMTGGVDIGANASTSAFKKYLFNDLDLPVLKTTDKHQEAADALLQFTSRASMMTDFDGELFTRFVERVLVYSRAEIGFELKCGITLKERLVR